MPRTVSERTIVFLVGAVQFVNILDFMIVMPLGPDFAVALGIPMDLLGFVGGAYTAAAAVAGLLGSLFLDRFDRRVALGVAMTGLVLGTAAAALATGLWTLLAARVVAGLFGGPATSLAISIVADEIPPERRGRAMGAVMGAFAVASVIGVPAGLELSRLGGWRLPFLAVAGVGAIVTAGAIFFLPPIRRHLARRAAGAPPVGLGALLGERTVLLSYAMTAVTMMGGFILIPNITPHLLRNLDFPRADLGVLYMVGGAAAFLTMRLVGRLVDRYGSFRVGTGGSGLLVVVILLGFVTVVPWIPVLPLFVLFFVALSSRNVAYNTLTSKVPSPDTRARFMSLQSAVQHLASAIGAFLSTKLLAELPDGRVAGVERVGLASIGLTLLLPPLLGAVEARVRRRDARPAPPAEPTSGLQPPAVPR